MGDMEEGRRGERRKGGEWAKMYNSMKTIKKKKKESKKEKKGRKKEKFIL